MVKESVGSKSGYSKRKENGRNLLVDFLMIDLWANLKVSLKIWWEVLIKSAYGIKSVAFSKEGQDIAPVIWLPWNLELKKWIEMN